MRLGGERFFLKELVNRKEEGRREIEIGGRGRERRGKEQGRKGIEWGSTTRNVYL